MAAESRTELCVGLRGVSSLHQTPSRETGKLIGLWLRNRSATVTGLEIIHVDDNFVYLF